MNILSILPPRLGTLPELCRADPGISSGPGECRSTAQCPTYCAGQRGSTHTTLLGPSCCLGEDSIPWAAREHIQVVEAPSCVQPHSHAPTSLGLPRSRDLCRGKCSISPWFTAHLGCAESSPQCIALFPSVPIRKSNPETWEPCPRSMSSILQVQGSVPYISPRCLVTNIRDNCG